MDSKHIERDYSAHRKSVIRPYDEYVKLEIFSYDPNFTKAYVQKDKSLKASKNATATSWKSLNCYKATDRQNPMIFDFQYKATEVGDYGIDIIYEQNNNIHEKVNKKNTNTSQDLVGSITIDETKSDVKFDGENNVLKRIKLYEHLTEGTHKFQLEVPHNCYMVGVIIHKIIRFVGDNSYGGHSSGEHSNMVLTTCTVTNSDMVKPTELSAEIFYDPDFECAISPSGFYMDYRDEVNFYVKNNEGKLVQIFGGYISSILPDSDRTKLTIACADRLVDGQNKYVLDQIRLNGGTSDLKETDYEKTMNHDFNSYPQVLKYLCDMHEVTLNSNISSKYTVDGEKFKKGLVLTFGKSKKIKKVGTSNCKSTPQKNYILLRNNPTSTKQQVWDLYKAKGTAKKPPEITDYPYMHITYGLGKAKTSYDSETTEKVDTSDTTAGSQKFTKCGVSQDGKYLMAIGKPSASKDKMSGWSKTVFKRKCPHCGSNNLVWDIDYGEGGYAPCRGNNEGGGIEGHIFCKKCDADYSCEGYEHYSWSNYKLEKVSKTVASSKSEKDKLRSGNMVAVPTSAVEVTPDDIIDSITKIAFKYKYKLGAGSSSYSSMKKCGYGDCWAFSDLIFTEMKKYGVSCKIKQYRSTPSVSNHRTVIYKDANGKWVDFPYREKGWSDRYNTMLNNYPIGASFKGTTIKENKGTSIGNVKAKTSTTKSQTTKVTHTKGYDKDKPFQGYLKLTYSLSQSFNAKKYAVYIKFTQTPSSDYVTTSGFNLYCVNNSIKQTTLRIGKDSTNQHDGLIYFLRSAVHKNENARFYLHNIQMIAPKIKPKDNKDDTSWYKLDNANDDQSSCKLDLYQITFDDNRGVESDTVASCGKSVNSLMQDFVKESGYYVTMEYGTHRKDDKIHFRVANNSEESYTATEGDNNNILSWNSITYQPINSMFNTSLCVFKSSNNKYNYIETRDIDSVLEYGEMTTIQTVSEETSNAQAYFNAIQSDKYNPEQNYTYTITVPNYPNIQLGDLVKTVANAKKLNSVKEVNSIKLSFEHDKIPRLQTTIGLGELAPDIQLQQNIRKLRESAKEETTYFKDSATPVTEEIYYEWDG